jgi:hypothetical protein
MDKTAEDQSPRGSQERLQGPHGVSSRGQTTGLPGGEGSVNVQIPVALYENLSHLAESMGFANVADYVIQVLRSEMDRAASDKGTTGYTQREIELIRKLLRDVECSD